MKLIIDIPEMAYEAFKEWHKQKVATVEQSIIANATPYEPKGDLISRSALLKALKTEIENIQPLSDTNYYVGVKQGLKLAETVIDNAPTVNYPFYQEAYQTGYEEGKNERLQGEWIANPLGDYVCNKCSWVVGKFERNFCPNCGVKMKGGAE